LNLLRSYDFDLELPSHSLIKRDQSQQQTQDITYYQLKELKEVLRSGGSGQRFAAMMTDDTVNEYGKECREMRRRMVVEGELISVIKGMWREGIRRSQSVMTKKMITEIVALIACERELIPMLV
jgi:hypothetical protein